MRISTEDIQEKLEALKQRYPSLSDFQVKPYHSVQARFGIDEVAIFIDRSWAETYRSHERFDYHADYLNWVFGGEGLASEISTAVCMNGEVVAVFFFTPRIVSLFGKTLSSGIISGLSVKPEYKKGGVAKFIHLNVLKMASVETESLSIWFDKTVKTSKRSHDIITGLHGREIGRFGAFPLNARFFDSRRAIANAKLNPFEKAGVIFFSAHPKYISNTNIEIVDENNVEEATTFNNKKCRERGYGRLFSPPEMYNYACFEGSRTKFSPIGLIHRKRGGGILGLIVGYPLNIIGKTVDTAFFLDYMCLDKEYEQKGFMTGVETAIHEKYKCFAILTVDQRFSITRRYLPTGTVLAHYNLDFTADLNHLAGEKRKVPILDHK